MSMLQPLSSEFLMRPSTVKAGWTLLFSAFEILPQSSVSIKQQEFLHDMRTSMKDEYERYLNNGNHYPDSTIN